jgi:hypothetical protein
MDSDPLDEFPAWTWVPGTLMHARGFSPDRLLLFERRFLVLPQRGVAGRFSGLAEAIDYRWPVVVVEQKVPLPVRGVLVPIGYGLGLVGIGLLKGGRLPELLRGAGFKVIEVRRWGWEAPHAVSEKVLGENVDQVPPCVVAER